MYILNEDRCALLQGSAFDILPALPDNFAGLIICDAPYGKHTHEHFGKERRADGATPRGELTFKHLDRDQVRFLAAQYVRLSQGWIIEFTDDRSIGWWGEAIQESGGDWIRTCSWVKTNPMPQLTMDRPGSGEEFIVIGHSGKRKLAWNGKTRPGVFRGPGDRPQLHPNQKPLWLMQELAALFAQPGELVLDPFTGSGSTGVGALCTTSVPGLTSLDNVGCPKCAKALATHMDGRPALPQGLRFLGIEPDPETLVVAEARLRAVLKGQLYDPQQQASVGQ